MNAKTTTKYAAGHRVEVLRYTFEKAGMPQEWYAGTVGEVEPIGGKGVVDVLVLCDDGTISRQLVGPRGGNKNIRPLADLTNVNR